MQRLFSSCMKRARVITHHYTPIYSFNTIYKWAETGLPMEAYITLHLLIEGKLTGFNILVRGHLSGGSRVDIKYHRRLLVRVGRRISIDNAASHWARNGEGAHHSLEFRPRLCKTGMNANNVVCHVHFFTAGHVLSYTSPTQQLAAKSLDQFYSWLNE